MNGILLIAEDQEIMETFTAMLSPAYTVYSAASAPEGLDTLKKEYRNISAVLIELALARKSGFYFSDQMLTYSSFSSIPMIAISDALPTSVDMDCLEHGYYDLITAIAPPQLVYKRIGNAIRAKDSLSLTEVEAMLKELPACIFMKDTECRYVFSTQYWNHLNTGGDPNWTIRGKTDLDIRKDKENARKAMEADRKILETGQGTEYVIEEDNDGVLDYLQLIKRPVFDENGHIKGIIALINNITDYQLLKLELEKRAKTDALSGLLNKASTQELVSMMLSNHREEEGFCALLMIDVDLFKTVNDTYGHAEGDRVLASIGRVITNNCRSMDIAGRIGGDEFMVLMRNIDAPENAMQLAERLEDQVIHTFVGDKLEGLVTLSIGIALSPDHGKDFETLFKAADAALYYVKKHGRAQFTIFSSEMVEQSGRWSAMFK